MLDGKRYHHIIDPRTGYPATASREVTICAPTAFVADAMTTRSSSSGPKKGLALVESLPDGSTVIVDANNQVWTSKGLEGKLFEPGPRRTASELLTMAAQTTRTSRSSAADHGIGGGVPPRPARGRVTVVERGIPGAEASSAAAGILGPQMEAEGPGPLLDLGLASRALYPSLAAELREATGIDVG